MWPKNVLVYRIPKQWDMTIERLEKCLSTKKFASCTDLEAFSAGWTAVRKDSEQLVHHVEKRLMMMFCAEKKLLPASVVSEKLAERCVELAKQQGYDPGRKQKKDIKEAVIDELLPKAFSVKKKTLAWFDLVNGWLIIDTSSQAKAEEVVKYLIQAIEHLPLSTLKFEREPVTAMTGWLSIDEAPLGFTIDQETELKSKGEGGATVRYLKHTPENADMLRQITTGKRCTRLAMTWADKISFVLTESFGLKKVNALDLLKDSEEVTGKNDIERFEAEFYLMATEIGSLLNDLSAELGEPQADGESQIETHTEAAEMEPA